MYKLKGLPLTGLLLFACSFFGRRSEAQSTSQNYVVTYVPRVPITVAAAIPGSGVASVNQTVQYFDGLGRPIQTVQTKGSPDQRDVVQPIAYDQYGRVAINYLPYTVSTSSPNDGSYKTAAISDQTSFYGNPTSTTWNAPGVVQTPFPSASTNFEPSPLNRPIEQGFPGDNWQLTGTIGATAPGHTQKIVWATNNATALPGYWAKNYSVTYLYSASHQYLYRNALVDLGSYAYGSLYVTVIRNENWLSSQTNLNLNTTQEYKDKFGRLILKRTFNHNPATGLDETLSTYYVYDDYGNLTYVLPPGANPDAGGITQGALDNLCYQYRYDGRNRLIEKKVPGRGWDMMIYNNLNQVIETQDSVQRSKATQQVSYVKYDAQGREIATGYVSITGTTGIDYRSTLQAAADAQTVLWETKSANGLYSNATIPSGGTRLITNYYDDYNISAMPTAYGAPTAASTMTRGFPTATLTAVLNTPSDGLWRLNYYDDLGRVTQAYKQHYLGGHTSYSTNNYDIVNNYYNFSNQIDTTIRAHYTGTTTATLRVTVGTSFDYDHMGRQLHSGEQIKGSNGVAQAAMYLSLVDYNEVGQVTARHYRSTDGTNYLTKIGYSYNERGWLTALTPLSGTTNFGEQLYYNAPVGGSVPAQYTGNVSQFVYNSPQMEVNNGKTSSSLNTVNYTYDNLNRLISSQSTLGKTDEGASYDLDGNIQNLVRTGTPGYALAGTFAYTYPAQSNQLSSVTLNSGVHAFRTYAYDGNGNATSDTAGKTLTYNVMNLPLVVKKGSVVSATYYYDAEGNKLRDVSASFGTTDYVDGIVYQNGQITFMQTSVGRAVLYSDSITYSYSYNIKDYLGNVRASYDNGGTGGTFREIQENDYYPFGLSQLCYDYANGNRYLYNAKEQQQDLYNKYDYGARFYDPAVARWTAIDPLAEISRRWSPYNYGEDNPIRNIDPDGMVTINGPYGMPTDIPAADSYSASGYISFNHDIFTPEAFSKAAPDVAGAFFQGQVDAEALLDKASVEKSEKDPDSKQPVIGHTVTVAVYQPDKAVSIVPGGGMAEVVTTQSYFGRVFGEEGSFLTFNTTVSVKTTAEIEGYDLSLPIGPGSGNAYSDVAEKNVTWTTEKGGASMGDNLETGGTTRGSFINLNAGTGKWILGITTTTQNVELQLLKQFLRKLVPLLDPRPLFKPWPKPMEPIPIPEF